MTAPAVPPSTSRPPGSLAVAPIIVGATCALVLPGVAAWAVFFACAAAVSWSALSPRGRGVLPPKSVKPTWALFPVAAATALGATMPRGGEWAGAFASVVLCAQALLLLGPPTSSSIRAAIAGSALVAATIVLRIDDRRLLGPVLAYAAALVAAFAALQGGSAVADDDRREPGTRRVTAPRGRGRVVVPIAGIVALWCLGLPLGMTVSSALPQPEESSDERDRPIPDDLRAPTAARGTHPAVSSGGGEPGKELAGEQFHSGARTRMKLGFVDTVKLDSRPALVVRVEGGEADAPLLLRGLSYDDFDGHEWGRSADVEREVGRSEPGRWLRVAPDPSGVALVRLTIMDVRGQAAGHLFLRAEPERVRLDAASQGVRLKASADGTVYSLSGLDPGAHYLEDARDPRPSAERVAAASSTGVSVPFPSCAATPPDVALLTKLAHEAVGDETRPAMRAARIAEWLAQRCTYVLSAPELKGAAKPVVAFLTQGRRGSCEYFASAETLMLRALGHPARMTVGYRGGDKMGDGAWSFRGTHAHAWTELWLDGVGWVPFDATPPDRRAADAQGPGEMEDAGGPGSKLSRAFLAVLERVIPLVPWALAVLLLLAVVARRAGLGLPPPPGAGPAGPRGPYARALAALRAAGVARRAPWTPREFEGVAAPAVRAAAPALESLTRAFERGRYGGVSPDAAERTRMERDADDVVRAAKARRREGPSADDPRARRPRRPAPGEWPRG